MRSTQPVVLITEGNGEAIPDGQGGYKWHKVPDGLPDELHGKPVTPGWLTTARAA